MKHISVLVKPASSLCNLRCKYCFYANVSSLREVRSYGKMTESVTEKMIEQIFIDLEDGDHLTLAFQGGEPTLAGLDYYRKVVACVKAQGKRVQVHYTIQTNGTLINERWCEFLKENEFLVGVSIDGHPEYHDLNRVDTKGTGTFQRIILTKELFDRYQIDYNVLCTLTNPLGKEAKKVWQFLQKHKIQYVQFIPCLDDLDTQTRSSYALTPKRFFGFYRQLLSSWLAELEKGNYISVKLFDDLLNLLVRKQVTACGILGSCQVQYVIEADGSVYPCDFYVLDEYRMGYIQESSLKELFNQDISKKFVCEKPALPEKCQSCPFKNICGGGCKRMKDAIYVDEKDYCGYQELLQLFLPKVNQILDALQNVQKGQAE
ncbi:radical SAM/SPASM domain-containing protein [Enterococcus sp. JM4C]|uniref:radical SAM/SPASM domain-containing protein n=1 Tax=Candidatus Enterococcus huntleyi TaxID=1857217 RepID=UPI001379D0A1|nr:SPASM domain-containing protein [Enterococcus sp. JM4C]KAF1299222.1 radical SAM/SPASM domain-containing protein [Enterococcus sp. JM4C]